MSYVEHDLIKIKVVKRAHLFDDISVQLIFSHNTVKVLETFQSLSVFTKMLQHFVKV